MQPSFDTLQDGDVRLTRDARPVVISKPKVPATAAVAAYDSQETGVVPHAAKPGYLWVNPPGVSRLGQQPFNPNGDYFVLPSFGPIYEASPGDPNYKLGGTTSAPRYKSGDSYTYALHHDATPATPGVPGDAPPPPTWDAIGVLTKRITGTGGYSFTPFEGSVGVLSGFQSDGISTAPESMSHAFYQQAGKLSLLESGKTVLDGLTYVNADRLTIRLGDTPQEAVLRILGALTTPVPGVRYFQNDALLYTSTARPAASPQFTTLFFGDGDQILDADTAPVDQNYGAGSFTPLTGTEPGRSFFEALTGTGTSISAIESRGGFETLSGVGADVAGYTYGRSSFAALTAEGYGGPGSSSVPRPAYNTSTSAFAAVTGSGRGSAPNRIDSGAAFSPVDGIGADVTGYGFGAGTFEPLYAPDLLPFLELRIAEILGASSGVELVSLLIGMVDETGRLSMLFNVRIGTIGTIIDRLGARATFTVQGVLYGLIASRLGITSSPLSLTDFEDAIDVWIVNTESNATTRYEQFDFNSFALIAGHYYGMNSNGLYLLEGDDDDGEPIRASIDFGKQNFGNLYEKRVPNVYLGVATTGQMVLKVVVENDQEYFYTARESSTDQQMQTQRFDLGKGLRSNFYRFEVFNQDGQDFDMQSIEFVVVSLSRRI